MPSFQTPFQRALLDGSVAVWMLAALPLAYRTILLVEPNVEDEARLGLLLVVAFGLRLYGFVARSLYESTSPNGRQLQYGYSPSTVALGTMGFGAYFAGTCLLPIWLAALFDIALLVVVVRYSQTRSRRILEALASEAFYR